MGNGENLADYGFRNLSGYRMRVINHSRNSYESMTIISQSDAIQFEVLSHLTENSLCKSLSCMVQVVLMMVINI